MVVIHELRQPLGTIAMSTEALALASHGDGNPGPRELECIRAAVKALGRLASDLLDASSLEARRMKVVCAPLKIAALVRDAIRHLPHLSERCELHLEPGADVVVRADAGRVEQVLGNLKELIEAHGGRIWAKSAPGVITQFHFTLPLESLQ